MTEATTTTTPSTTTTSTPPPVKKWAGKFDTPEALEEAYNNTAKVYQENQELKTKHEESTKKLQSIEENEQKRRNSFEERKKVLGDDKINILHDYTKKFLPEKLQEVALNKLIEDEEAMNQALKDRDNRLNSKAPGMNSGSTSTPERYDGQKDLLAAREEHRRHPTQKNREKYIDLCRQIGEERFKK